MQRVTQSQGVSLLLAGLEVISYVPISRDALLPARRLHAAVDLQPFRILHVTELSESLLSGT